MPSTDPKIPFLKKTGSHGLDADLNQAGIPGKQPDEALWNSFRKGSESGFIDIYNKFFQTLYNYGRQLSADPELSKDCIQEVFLNLRKRRDTLPKVSSPKAYLLRSMRNMIISELDKKNKYRHTGIPEDGLNFHVTPCYEKLLIARQLSEAQIGKIRKAIADLTRRQREIIYFFYYDNLGYEEIRQIMGFSSARAARNLLYRALKDVKNKLTHS